MKKIALPPQEYLRKILDYAPETGLLSWRERTQEMFSSGGNGAEVNCKNWNAQFANKQAFKNLHPDGYKQGHIKRKKYLAHRVIWKLVTGVDPEQVDHINGNPADNRWINLRDVTQAENHRNKAVHKNNTSGKVGVCWYKRDNKWGARIKVKGAFIHLGSFDSFEDACAAREAAEIKYGFHKNHGRRARTLTGGGE